MLRAALALTLSLAVGCAESQPDEPLPEDDASAAEDVAVTPDVRDATSVSPDRPDVRDVTPAIDVPPAMDVPPARDVPPPLDVPPAMDVPPSVDVPPAVDAGTDLGPPLPYPTRTAMRIKGLQPDFWPSLDEVVGNNTGGVAMNLVWASWEPSPHGAPCADGEELFDGHCFTVDRNVDQAIAAYTARGVVVTAVVYGSPPWARARRVCTPASAGFEVFCAPDDPSDYGRFARYLARRYDGRRGHGRLADFVVWNEVNSNDWFDIGCGQGAGACDVNAWVSAYAALWSAAYDGVTAEQPTAKVLVSLEHHFGTTFDRPAQTSPLLSGETFLRRFAALVGSRAWRVAYHPYPPNLLRPGFSPDDDPQVTYGSLGVLLGWLRREFPATPSAWEVQLTESGVNSAAPNSSAAAQATGVCDSLRNALGTPGVESYIYHRMVDHPVELAAGLGVGLRNTDGSPKPAWSVWALANRDDLSPPMLSCGFEDLPYVRLRRSYNAARGHWASTRVAPAGFREESSWRLHRDPRDGTVLLYECRVGAHDLLTRDVGCEGLRPLGPVGYAWTDPGAGRRPIYRCRVGEGVDHFVSVDPGCEGQVTESLLGYGQ
ncbi:MAG: DUF5722 domain-containing protein [Polyangiales bacterium]